MPNHLSQAKEEGPQISKQAKMLANALRRMLQK